MLKHDLKCVSLEDVKPCKCLIDLDVVLQELHSQLDGPFAEDAHFDKESWSQLFAPIMGHSSRVDFV